MICSRPHELGWPWPGTGKQETPRCAVITVRPARTATNETPWNSTRLAGDALSDPIFARPDTVTSSPTLTATDGSGSNPPNPAQESSGTVPERVVALTRSDPE